MPDGDRFHTGIARRFQKPYKVICEGRTPTDVTEVILLRAVKMEIQKHGDAVVEHVIQIAGLMDRVLAESGFDVAGGCIAASAAVDNRRYDRRLPPRLSDLVCDAAKGYLHDIRYGRESAAVVEGVRLLERVFHRLYRCEFEEPVVSKSEHFGGVDSRLVADRLMELRPTVDAAFGAWAEKAAATGSLASLRLPRRTSAVAVDPCTAALTPPRGRG